MEKIKRSFIKIFPAVLIVAIASTVISAAENIAENLIFYGTVAHAEVTAAGPSVFDSATANNWVRLLFYIIEALFLSQFYVGFYRYCFSQIDGEKIPVSAIFDFYRDKSKFLKSVAANNFILVPVFLSLLIVIAAAAIIAIFVPSDRIIDNYIGNYLLFLIAAALIVFAVAELFFLAPYAYAKYPDDGVIMAVKRSVRLCKKIIIGLMILHMVGIALLYGLGNMFLSKMMRTTEIALNFHIIKFILEFLIGAFFTWLNITIAYLILDRESKIIPENADPDDITVIDDTEDEPFIKPYDFYIEADNRYNDEKTFTVETVRDFDILKVLDEMDLTYDVINYFGVRKKLKRLFDDLAFDISEYVTYEGGRTVENAAYDEIDDVKLEITVEISKQSDNSPYEVTVRINEKD